MATLGNTAEPTSTQEWNGLNTNNAMAQLLTMPAGGPWNITKIGVWLAGKDTAADVRMCIWSAGGTLVAQSTSFTAASQTFALGHNTKYEMPIGPYQVNGGQSVYIGFWRNPTEAVQNGRYSSGSHLHDTQGSSPESLSGWSTDSSGGIGAYLYYESANVAPNAPTSLTPTGDTCINNLAPTLAGHFSDPDAGDTMSGYEIAVYEDDGTTLKWDSGTVAGSGTSFSKVYAGPALTGNTFYKWKARTKDAAGLWGPYSALQRFKVNSVPNAPSVSLAQSPTTDLGTLTPTFNITHSDPDASDSQMLGYHLTVYASDGVTVIWDTGDVAVTATTTKAVAYGGSSLAWGATYKWQARTKDSNGAWGAYCSQQYFTTHKTSIPTSLAPTGDTVVGSLTPTLTGGRGNANDSLVSAEIELYAPDAVTLIWSSGVFTTGVTSSSFSKQYAGSTLAYSTAYGWRVRVTGSTGGTSSWSPLQWLDTPNSGDVNATAPLGSGISSLTPTFTFTRTSAFNAYQIVLYAADGTTVLWDSGTLTMTSGTSGSKVYPGSPALTWNTDYFWKVRVSSDSGSTWGNGYTGLLAFTTDAASLPTLEPADGSWLGAADHVWPADNLTGVTNGTSASTSIDTADLQEGGGSTAIAITSLASSGTSHTYKSVARDLSKYGAKTAIKVWVKASSLTNISTMRLRFTFATSSDYAEYNVIPSGTGTWEQKSVVKGTPTATGGTVDWTSVSRVGIVVVAGAGSVTSTIKVDDVQLDATTPSLDGTTTNGETLTNFRVIVYAPDQTTVMYDSGDVSGSGSTYSIAYAGTTGLVKGTTYYWKSRYTKSTGAVGDYTPLQAFALNADPTAPTSMGPATGAVPTTLTPTFTATFSDPDLSTQGDTPTAFEVEVYRNSDSVLMHKLRGTTSLVAGANSLTRTTEGSALSYEVEYKWRARYADSFGQYGAWTSYNVFKPTQPPTATITSPGSTVSSPSFAVVWSFSSPGGKGQQTYRVRLYRDSDSVLLWDTGVVASSLTTATVPAGYLVNSTAYDIAVDVTDSDGVASAQATALTTSAWTAPSAITGFSVETDENTSIVSLTWDQSNLSGTDFSFYQVYRKLLADDAWTAYAVIGNEATTQFDDHFAGNGVDYQYKITVFKKVPGDVDLESGDSDILTVNLSADVWFVIGADLSDSHSFELPVSDEDHTEPIQQEVFEPLGSKRKTVVRGKALGAEGSLTIMWTSDEVATAQERLRYLTDNAGPHILKSPFGDVWQVEFAGPSKKYKGGGHLTVVLTWIEVV